MKRLAKHWVTSVFGILFLLTSLAMYILWKKYEFDFSLVELLVVAGLGFLLLWAKDDFLMKLWAKIFGIKNE